MIWLFQCFAIFIIIELSILFSLKKNFFKILDINKNVINIFKSKKIKLEIKQKNLIFLLRKLIKAYIKTFFLLLFIFISLYLLFLIFNFNLSYILSKFLNFEFSIIFITLFYLYLKIRNVIIKKF